MPQSKPHHLRPPHWVLHERHWMHIWKVGYQRCALCSSDSRTVASLIDSDNNVLEQVMYCPEHARVAMNTLNVAARSHASDLDLELGIDIEVRTDDEV